MVEFKDILRLIGRTGLVARAIVYSLIGLILCFGIFLRREPADGVSPTEGFESIEQVHFGVLALIALGAGLLAYTAFRFIQATQDSEREGAELLFARLGMISSGLSYALVAFAAFSVAFDQNEKGSSNATRSIVATLLEQPFGRTLIAIFVLVVAAIGVAQIFRVISEEWKSGLDLDNVRRSFIAVAEFAISGRGLLIVLIGLSTLWASWDADADEAMGLTQVLAWLHDQMFGALLYFTSGLIMIGYGVYGLLQAVKYRF